MTLDLGNLYKNEKPDSRKAIKNGDSGKTFWNGDSGKAIWNGASGKAIWNGLLDWIYPPSIYCICCGDVIDPTLPYSLCPVCVRSLHWITQSSCERCGREVAEGRRLCQNCRDFSHVYEKGESCVRYGLLERSLMHRFKYGKQSYLYRSMAELMCDKLAAAPFAEEPDLIVPVPMNRNKQKRRGFNQAELLASEISERTGIPWSGHALIRQVNTAPMSQLSMYERRENLKNVFTVPVKQGKIIAGQNILLVDDIYTMGTTADGCGEALKKAGARRVYVMTFSSAADVRRREE